mgnify:CR=1 FL=1
MYKILNERERKTFIKRYFKEWGNDIKQVTLIDNGRVKEYLINEHYLYIIKK